MDLANCLIRWNPRHRRLEILQGIFGKMRLSNAHLRSWPDIFGKKLSHCCDDVSRVSPIETSIKRAKFIKVLIHDHCISLFEVRRHKTENRKFLHWSPMSKVPQGLLFALICLSFAVGIMAWGWPWQMKTSFHVKNPGKITSILRHCPGHCNLVGLLLRKQGRYWWIVKCKEVPSSYIERDRQQRPVQPNRREV